MKWEKIRHTVSSLIQIGLKTGHNRIIAAGLIVALCYVPLWIIDALLASLKGMPSILTMLSIALGLQMLWSQRKQLANREVIESDRLIGYLLILGGVLITPFCFALEWTQRLQLMVILAGIACSCWGASFFQRYPLPTFLLIAGLFPEPFRVAHALWITFTPPQILERFMAWSGALGLKLVGIPAASINTVISMPSGAVDVQWRCNGSDMALTIAFASLLLGLFLKQNLPKTMMIIVIGVVLALISNIPRIMLLAMSEAYWGKATFDFWHGVWGGQIFSTAMFTIYYYVVMAFVKQRPRKETI